MPTQKRDLLPRNIHRFNYWEYFRPGGLKTISPLKQHIQHQFNLLLNASPAVWNKEVRPWLHKDVSTIRNRPFYALKYYVECDKEWGNNKKARAVLKQLSPHHKAAILHHYRTTWPARSKRPARLMRTWKNLLSDIAREVDTFERFCDNPTAADEMSGTPKRIYLAYSRQAIKLLGGGGAFVKKRHRSKYRVRNLLDESDNPKFINLLNAHGRIDSSSIIDGVDWLKCTSNVERRDAKKRTIHWFHHALRNMREYCNGRLPVPWPAECEKQCRQIQNKLRNA